MKFSEPVPITLRTVTPVFVGDGDILKSLSYVLEGNTLHVIDSDRFFERLTDSQRESYMNWIEPVLGRLSEFDAKIADAGRNFRLRGQLRRERRDVERQLSWEEFARSRIQGPPVRFAHSLDCIAYSVSCGARPDQNGFRTHIKDGQGRPYIPGTEIKGAIRTSLLYALLEEPDVYNALKQKLVEFEKLYESGASAGKKTRFLWRLDGEMQYEQVRGVKDDAKFDFLKLVQVGDATPLSENALQVELTQSLGTSRYTKTWVETLASMSSSTIEPCTFRLAVAEDLANKENWALNKLGLQRLSDWLSVPKLLDACFRRSQDLLKEEEEHFSEEPQILSIIQSLKQQNQPDAPLLRLGAGQGFLGTTVNLHVKNRDPELYDRAIRESVSFVRRWRTQPENFPKTRRVIADRGGRGTGILGWVKLSPGEKEPARRQEASSEMIEELKSKFGTGR